MTDHQDTTTLADRTAAGGRVQALVMRYTAWREKHHVKRLYVQIWRANAIILRERHGATARQNQEYWGELEACADALERAAVTIKHGFDDA